MDPKIPKVGAVSFAQGGFKRANIDVIRLTTTSPMRSNIIDTEPIELSELRKLMLLYLYSALLCQIDHPTYGMPEIADQILQSQNILKYSPLLQSRRCKIVSSEIMKNLSSSDFSFTENELNCAGDHGYLLHEDSMNNRVITDPTYVQFVHESKIDGLPSIMIIEANNEKQLIEGLERYGVMSDKFSAWSSALPREKCSLWNFSIDSELEGKSLLTEEAQSLKQQFTVLPINELKTIYKARKIASHVFVNDKSEKMEMLLGEKEFPKEVVDYIKENFNLSPQEAKAIVRDAHKILLDNHYGYEVQQLLQ